MKTYTYRFEGRHAFLAVPLDTVATYDHPITEDELQDVLTIERSNGHLDDIRAILISEEDDIKAEIEALRATQIENEDDVLPFDLPSNSTTNISKRENKILELMGGAGALAKNFTWDDFNKLWDTCSDWNSEHPDEEIFMAEIYKADGYEHDGLMVEDDIFYYEED